MSISRAAFWRRPQLFAIGNTASQHHENQMEGMGHGDKMPTPCTSTGKPWQVTTSIMSISWESLGREKQAGQHHEHHVRSVFESKNDRPAS